MKNLFAIATSFMLLFTFSLSAQQEITKKTVAFGKEYNIAFEDLSKDDQTTLLSLMKEVKKEQQIPKVKKEQQLQKAQSRGSNYGQLSSKVKYLGNTKLADGPLTGWWVYKNDGKTLGGSGYEASIATQAKVESLFAKYALNQSKINLKSNYKLGTPHSHKTNLLLGKKKKN